jgi:hypothetical protein
MICVLSITWPMQPSTSSFSTRDFSRRGGTLLVGSDPQYAGQFEFILRRSFFAALHEGIAARKYNLQLHKLNPDNVDCLLVLGVGNYALGSLPRRTNPGPCLTDFRPAVIVI